MPFGVEKLEWCGYPIVKKIDDIFILFEQLTNVTDRQTDTQTHRHRMTVKAALDASIARQKRSMVSFSVFLDTELNEKNKSTGYTRTLIAVC